MPGWRRRSARRSSRTVATTGRPPGIVARGRRTDDRAAPAAGIAPRPDRLGYRAPGVSPQAADRPLRAVRDPAPGRWRSAASRADRNRPHDVFDGGHAGTGLSIGQGLAQARDLRHGLERIAVVVGDAALMSGLSLEALNDIGHRQTQMLIVVNDNEMSISPTVGAFSKYLSEIKLSNAWRQSKSAYDQTRRADPGHRSDGARAQPPPARVGRQLRPARAAVRGSRDHLHRRRTRVTTSMPCSKRWVVRCSCPAPRSSMSGPRRAAASARPSATRSASTAPRCRRSRCSRTPRDPMEPRRRCRPRR